MNLTKKHKILIIGLGLIGGSYAEALTSWGFEVGAITKDRDSIDFALKKGIIQSGISFVEKEYVQMFDIVIFALYPKIFVEWIETYQSYFNTIVEMGKILGFKNISILTPEKHDEMIGFLSQLTHCIAITLMTCKDSKHLVEYTGDSFRDLTRIAKINEQMWSELFLMNKNELLSQMDLFLQEFEKLRDALAREDAETIKKMMRLSTKRRSYFDK